MVGIFNSIVARQLCNENIPGLKITNKNMYDEAHDVQNSTEVDSPPKSESPNPSRFIQGTSDSPDAAKNVTRLSERPAKILTKASQGDMSYFGNVSDDSETSSDTEAHEKGVVGMVSATTGIGHAPTPDFYDPKQYESLEVPDDVKEMFENIKRYTPQKIELEYRLKPFIPRFIPAVGDIDALLKVVPPPAWDTTKDLPKVINILGLEILDEPSGIQSEPALLHMKLRATSTAPRTPGPPVAVAKNHKDVNKWINDIETLHASQPAPMVTYSRPMPDTDNLMQEWSGPVERSLDENGFPEPMIDCSLSQYASTVCNLLDIPIPAPHGHKERLLALHSLFTLYTAVRNSNIVN